jgi:hypothetical protein
MSSKHKKLVTELHNKRQAENALAASEEKS